MPNPGTRGWSDSVRRWRSEARGVTAEILTQAAASLGELDGLARRTFAVFWEAPALNDRFINQYALFSMLSDAGARLDDWLNLHPECCRRIIIPASLKWEIRDKLDQANITERVLFPGLDGLCRWLKRYYSPKEPEA